MARKEISANDLEQVVGGNFTLSEKKMLLSIGTTESSVLYDVIGNLDDVKRILCADYTGMTEAQIDAEQKRLLEEANLVKIHQKA